MNQTFKKWLREGIVIAFLIGNGGVVFAATEGPPSNAQHYYLKALLYESQGNLISAQQELDEALRIEPHSALLNRTSAEILFFLGQFPRAQKAIEKANELDPDDSKAHLLAGQIYWSMGDIQTAEKKLKRAVELSPDDSEALLSLGMAVTTRDPDEAIRLYKEFLVRHPNQVQIQERLAQLYRGQGDLENAKKAWETALEWAPGSLRAHLALAQIAEVNKDTATAIGHYEAVLHEDPTNLPLLLRVGELRYRNNEMAEASKAFSQAIQVAPHSASANFWMALLHEYRGEWEEAIRLLKQVADQSPEAGVLLRLSYYYTQAGQFKNAIAILKQLSESEPENTDFLNYLAIAYEQFGRFKEATQTLQKLIDIDTRNPEYRFYLATLYDRMKNFAKAEEALKYAIKLDPDYGMALNYLGYSYADRGVHLEEAKKLLTRAVELEPERSAFLDSLGWVYFRMGKYQKAETYLQKASLAGKDPLIWEHLGDVRLIQQNLTEAILAYDEAIRLRPDQKKLSRRIMRLVSKLSSKEKLVLFMKRATATYDDLRGIQGLVQISVCEGQNCFESKGEFQYEHKGDFRIEVPGPLSGPILLVVKPYKKEAQYGALHPKFQTVEYFVTRAADRMAAFLSGDVFRSVDMVALTEEVKERGKEVVSSAGDFSIVFSRKTGFVNRFLWKSNAGSEILRLASYQTKEWPWIPFRLVWEDPAQSFSISLEFINPVLSLVSDAKNGLVIKSAGEDPAPSP